MRTGRAAHNLIEVNVLAELLAAPVHLEIGLMQSA